MNTARISIVLAGLLSVSNALPAHAQESTIRLADGPQLALVTANCSGCHSLDYIQMNSPFPNAALWDAEVAKMRNVYGAPISDADAVVIANYLKQNYGS